jgi:hypothetical protein
VQRLEICQDAQTSLEPAAIGNRIEMTAQEKGLLQGAFESSLAVACGVVVVFDGKTISMD